MDTSDAPETADWADKAKALVEKWHPIVADMLKSDGFTAPGEIKLIFKKEMNGIAYASGTRVVIAAAWIKKRPDDYGMVIHEMTHTIQAYRGRNPGWLVEGIADYVRFFKFEPGKIGRINAEQAHFDGSYRVSAAFLAFVTDKYDGQLVQNRCVGTSGRGRCRIWPPTPHTRRSSSLPAWPS